jgi:MoxR-like ATPase
VQSALLEAMQEKQVTIGDQTFKLEEPFLVLATQNPIEQEGTYPLPEAQLDRFVFKLLVGPPDRDREIELVRLHGHRSITPRVEELGIRAVCGLAEITAARRVIDAVRVDETVAAYIVDLARATREHPDLQVGASPRAAVLLACASRASAALEGRDYVVPDDAIELAPHVLRHRVVMSPGAEMEGRTGERTIAEILEQVQAPR